jgi:hypothetical protein
MVIFAGNRKDALLLVSELEKEREIAQTKKLAADANERAGKLEKEAADLTAHNLALEAAIAPRRLSGRQQKGLASLTQFASRTVGVKSYSSDTEGLILASQIIDALSKSKIRIEDNRLTMQPAGSVSFGISVEGPDTLLVGELKKILSMDGNLMADSSIHLPNRGFSAQVSFGTVSGGTPPGATITVGVKPIK